MILRIGRSRPRFGDVNLHGGVFNFVFACIRTNTLKLSATLPFFVSLHDE